MRVFYLALTLVLIVGGLAACTTSDTGKPVVTSVTAVSGLDEAADTVDEVKNIYALVGTSVVISADLDKAEAGLRASAASLVGGPQVQTGDLKANVNAADAAINAAIAGVKVDHPTTAAVMQVAYKTFLTALKLHNDNAAQHGWPLVPVPASPVAN